jgi:hypothetical protein
MQGVKEDRYGSAGLPTFSMVVRAMMRMTGSPLTAITEAIVEGGGSARTKRSKFDIPPQAWTIRPLSRLHAPPPPQLVGPVMGSLLTSLQGVWGLGRLQLGHALGIPLSIMSKKNDDAGGDCEGGCTIADPRRRGKVWAQTTKYQ